jgi:wobble nucleotide-excising tRNase
VKVTRISKIRGHRVFRNFTWPESLQSFGQFNLIYGWNGSGKTTLASLFRHLQTRSAVTEGDVEFDIDGTKVGGSDQATAHLPAVRVFNRDFIASTILAAGGRMDPIYYLGEDSVEKQRQVEKLKNELDRAETDVVTARSDKSRAEKALDEFCITKARIIKELLISSRTTSYNNYDKSKFKQAIEKQTEASAAGALLTDNDKERLRTQKDAQPKGAVATVAVAMPDFQNLEGETEALLQRSVTSQVLEELVTDRDVGSWVQRGLALHSGDRKTDRCRFCGEPLRASRVHELEAHFNDAFVRFQSEVDELALRVESGRVLLVGVQLPEPSRLYDHLSSGLQSAATEARRLLNWSAGFLGSLHEALLRKRDSPFGAVSLRSIQEGTPGADRALLRRAIDAVNAVIEKHNATTGEFQSEIDKACQALEQCYVAEAFAEYRQLTAAVKAAESALQALVDKPRALKEEIEGIEREIVEHRKPAEELNAELCSYLGRDELRLVVKETGYTMTRGEQPARDLSEGEKTAIAFLYFLKSLQDKSVDLANGIVVVDDPVSSLDANALFSAFGYMKERTKGAGQLFVLTHNFSFFRQVKHWFHHLPKQNSSKRERRPARFYLLNACTEAGNRTASLVPMDPLLEQYESEYHYLFKRVYEEAHQPDSGAALDRYYVMPNIARRLVEAFLAFRHPDCADDLSKRWTRSTSTRAGRPASFGCFTRTPTRVALRIPSTTPRCSPRPGQCCATC